MAFDDPPELEPNEFEMALFYLKQGQKPSPKEVEIITKEIEALQQWIKDVQGKTFVNCIYCGHRYGAASTTPVALADIMKQHVAQCPKHPLSVTKKALSEARLDMIEAGLKTEHADKVLKWLGDGTVTVPPDVEESDEDASRVVAIVERSSHEEHTYAIVSCLRTGEIQRDDQMLKPIEAAISEWVDKYDSGKYAWSRSSRDFNVGDLSTELGDKDLEKCLVAHGVFDLEIETFVNDEPTANWTYDKLLVDETQFTSEE
jgi:hypothetical protein